MILTQRVESIQAGMRYLEDIVKVRQIILGLHRKQSATRELDVQLLLKAQANLEFCQQLLAEDRREELLMSLRKLAGIKVRPRNRKAKQQHRKAAA